MLDTILNPYNLGWLALATFVIGTIVAVAVGIVAGLSAAWRAREKRDGLR